VVASAIPPLHPFRISQRQRTLKLALRRSSLSWRYTNITPARFLQPLFPSLINFSTRPANPMNTTQTSTVAHSPNTSYHGVTALIYSDAMDADTDGQHFAHSGSDKDIMDTTLDCVQNAPDKGKTTGLTAEVDAPVTATETTTAAELDAILERPRQGADDGAQESPKLMRKTPL